MNMTRTGAVDNWSTREKLALALSVLRSGDQNWVSASRVIRTLGEPNRPPDWFSQKHCAKQYESLLSNVGTIKRKKRTTDNNSGVETAGETIVKKLAQERMEELRFLMAEYKLMYLKEKQELEEIRSGQADDRLNEIMIKLEHAEKYEDEEHAALLKQWQDKKQKEAERLALQQPTENVHSASPSEVKPTSPLLTSLLQSPSPALLHRNPNQSISNLLSSPSVASVSPLRATVNSTSSATTLSRLLENPISPHHQLPANDPLNKGVIPTHGRIIPGAIPSTVTSGIDPGAISHFEQVLNSPRHSPLRHHQSPMRCKSDPNEEDLLIKQIVEEVEKTEAQLEADKILDAIKVEVDDLTPVILDDAIEIVSSMEAESNSLEVIVKTANHSNQSEIHIKSESQDDSSLTSDNIHSQTNESDILEEHLEQLSELDSRAVEMIVVGTNQPSMINVNHDGSVESVEEVVSINTSASNETGITSSDDTQAQVDISKDESIIPSNLESNIEPVISDVKLEESIVENDNMLDDHDNLEVQNIIKELVDESPNKIKEIVEDTEVVVNPEQEAGEIETVKCSDIVQKSEDIALESSNLDQESGNVVSETSGVSQISESNQKSIDDSKDSSDKIEESSDDILKPLDIDQKSIEKVDVQTKTSIENDSVITTKQEDADTEIDNAAGVENPSDVDATDSVTVGITETDNDIPLSSITSTVAEPPKEEVKDSTVSDERSSSEKPSKSEIIETEVNVETEKRSMDEGNIEKELHSVSIPDEVKSKEVIEPEPLKMESAVVDSSKTETEEVKVADSDVSVAEEKMEIEETKEEILVDKKKENVDSTSSSFSLPKLKTSPSEDISTPVPTLSKLVTSSIPPTTVEVVCPSRPDTPSTEEDNEPVANLIKKQKRKISDSKPNSPAPLVHLEDSGNFRAWKKSIMLVYNRLATHKFASLFLKPITDEQAHGYHGVIHRPMDLSTIKKNIELGILRTTVDFQRDMLLMFQNAIMYNNSTTLVYERALEMQKECIQHMQLMVEAMGEGVPLRRESADIDNKLNTRQRGTMKHDVPEVSNKRKRIQQASINSDSPANKRRKVEEP